MADAPVTLKEPFSEEAQQREADALGMWVFLATEVMLFGTVFMALYVMFYLHPQAAAAGTAHLNLWLGGLNTAVLLASGWTMALAARHAEAGRRRAVLWSLGATAGLGLAFLAIKAVEYTREYAEGLMPWAGPAFPLDMTGAHLFFNLYFVSTGLHAVHLIAGIGVVLGLAVAVLMRAVQLPGNAMTVRMIGLYWGLVDIVWIFLYPTLYLVNR